MKRNKAHQNERKDAAKNGARRKRQRGAVFVETALILVTNLSMILFILDMGRILLTEQFIAERARVGVRSAVVNNWSATQVANFVVYGSASSSSNNGGNSQNSAPQPGFLGLLPSQVTLTTYADSGIGDARYQVTVQGVPLATFVPFIAGQYHAPSITATMPVKAWAPRTKTGALTPAKPPGECFRARNSLISQGLTSPNSVQWRRAQAAPVNGLPLWRTVVARIL
jgi:hypothetical protein